MPKVICGLVAARSLRTPHRSCLIRTLALLSIATLFTAPIVNAQVTELTGSLTANQSACVTVLGGNCSQTAPLSGSYVSPSGALSASVIPSPAQTNYSYTSPPGGNEYFSNAASASAGGSYSLTTTSITASGGNIAATNQTCVFGDEACTVTADASAGTTFQAGFYVGTPTYYAVSFKGPTSITLGSTISTSSFEIYNSGGTLSTGTIISGPFTSQGILPAGSYTTILAGASIDSNTCTGCIASGTADFSFSMTLSPEPITLPNTVTSTLVSTSADASGNYVVSVALDNNNNPLEPGATLTAASVVVNQGGKGVTTPTSTALPLPISELPTTLALAFPPSAGAAGSPAVLRWTITYNGGSVSGSQRITLPAPAPSSPAT